MKKTFPEPNTDPEITIIGKNDEHEESMKNDPDFMALIELRNQQANQLLLTAAGDNAAQNAQVLVANTNETWINTKWRPIMGWLYATIVLVDFVVFPVLWNLLQVDVGEALLMWQPITLQGGGLIHLSFGAILGLTSYGRSKEKMVSMQTNQNN
jgi:hypothetical protein